MRGMGAVAVLMLWLLVGGQAMAMVLWEPPPIPVPAGRSADEVVAGIKTAMSQNDNWSVERASPGHIVAQYTARIHQVWLDIRYDADAVTLRYNKSLNMSFDVNRRGERLISWHYNRWVKSLVDSIGEQLVAGASEDALTLVRLERGPVRNEPLSGFSHFELREMEIRPPVRERPANLISARSLHVYVEHQIKPLLEQWQKADVAAPAARTLVIQPIVENAGFMGSGHYSTRGTAMGHSWIQLRLRCTDAESGALVAERLVSGQSEVPAVHYATRPDDQMLLRVASDVRTALLEDYGDVVPQPAAE